MAKRKIMKGKGLFILVFLTGFLSFLPGKTGAQVLEKLHQDLSASVTLDFNSKYVWRGITWVDDMVFQPDFSLSFKYLSLGVWQNVAFTDSFDEGGVGTSPASTEVDYYMDYSGEYRILSYSMGWIYYQFPHTGINHTQEIYATLGLGIFLNPAVTLYADVDDNSGGLYWNFALSHDFELDGLTLTPSFGLGICNTTFTSYYTGVNKESSHLMDMNFGLNMAVPLGGFFEKLGGTMNLHANYSMFPDGSVRDQIKEQSLDNKDAFYAGLGFSFGF